MPTFFDGLPLHPLFVHATTVLVPLAVLAALALVARPAWRDRYGIAGAVVALVALVSVPLATSTGEGLEKALPHSALIEEHTRLADTLLPLMLALAVGLVGWVALDRYRSHVLGSAGPGTPARSAPGWMQVLAAVLLVTATVGALGSAVQVVRIGHSGSNAVWHGEDYRPGQGPTGS